jgi:homoserine kinase type II
MTVKPTTSENDFLEIFSHYDLGAYEGFKEFKTGACQTTILFLTSKGKYVLHYYENRTEKHILFEVQLINYLKDNNYPTPKIIKTSSGDFYGKYKDKYYIVVEFIEGEHSKKPDDYFNKEYTSKVIEIVARLHNLTIDYNPGYIKYREEFNTGYAWREYQKISREVRKEERAKWFKNELDKLEFPLSLPKSVCHADLNYGNFLFRDGKIASVLDFDMSFYTYVIYDVAGLIYWWAFPPEIGFKEKEASFIVNEYLKYRMLSETEKKHIYDALKLIILLGISWSKESDFEDSNKAIEYLNNLGREGFYSKIFTH